MKILIAEDEKPIREGLTDLLRADGYETVSAPNGRLALELYHREKVDLALLDIMMPELSGYDLCREIRRDNPSLPIIFLTAREEEIDKVLGLELGADDYIVKPFGVRELLARIKSVLRRSSLSSEKKNSPGGFTLPSEFPFARGTVDSRRFTFTSKKGETIDLIEREVELMAYFAHYPDQVLSREELLEKIWGVDYYGTTRTLDQHIAKLRQKIEENTKNPRFIQTVHGSGYRYRS
jgi:DNA-binding response OmpR family regulator